jgi:hypothetical protein
VSKKEVIFRHTENMHVAFLTLYFTFGNTILFYRRYPHEKNSKHFIQKNTNRIQKEIIMQFQSFTLYAKYLFYYSYNIYFIL